MRKEITEEQITALMQAIPRAEEVDRLRAEIERLRAKIERLRAEMLHLAEWCEMEVPLTHDYMAYRLRKALEATP